MKILNCSNINKRDCDPFTLNNLYRTIVVITTFLYVGTHAAQAQQHKVGWLVPATKIEHPKFFSIETGNGAIVRKIYTDNNHVRSNPLVKLPESFNQIVQVVKAEIDSSANQTDKSNKFYVGPNGIVNGPDYSFEINNLPSKLVKLAFCFGVDPFVLSGLIRQESLFKREISSDTLASGFMQLTNDAIAEASEQLGLLGPDYHGKDAPEIFKQYISCYLGPQTKWKNMWEDGTLDLGFTDDGSVDGRKAYNFRYIRNNKGKKIEIRQWKQISLAKKWLNEDPDRNLIYGAIFFKTLLGKFGAYEVSLKKYNVSHKRIYTKNVFQFYQKMKKSFRLIANASPKDRPPLDVSGSYRPVVYDTSMPMPNIASQNLWQDLDLGATKCSIPYEQYMEDILTHHTVSGFYTDQELAQNLIQYWQGQGFCRQNSHEV